MYYGKPSPFSQWWEQYITKEQIAVSGEIRKMLAQAFEGGRESVQTKPLSDEEILYEGRGCSLEDDWERLEFGRAIEAKVKGQ
jgi:hypothetical protein